MLQTLHKKLKTKNFFLSHLLVVLIATSAIYLTPLKNINIIEPVFNDVNPTQFYEQYSKDPSSYIFIDVRDTSAYNSLHAVGSISMPLHTLYDQRKLLPKRGKKIVLICSGGRSSGVGFMYLQHYGFFNIERVSGGIENWINEGLPTEGTDKNVSIMDIPTCETL